MKKVIALLAAAVMGSFAWADEPAGFTSIWSDIQSMTNGQTNIAGYDSEGKHISETPHGDIRWWASNCNDTATFEQPAVCVSNVTDTFNYLKLDTDQGVPLLRTFSPVTEKTEGQADYKSDPVDIADHGLFVDTWMQFTGTDTEPTDYGDAKILVWLRTIEADDTTEPVTVGSTNLMVTCGVKVGDDYVATNYVLNVDVSPADVAPDQWYRLTIRADKETSDNNAKFKIYLDGALVKTVDDLDLFPALTSGADTLTLTSAGFEGSGNLKDVNLLNSYDGPSFAKDPTYLKLTWDEHVASITIGGENVIDGQTSPYNYPITNFVNTITATIAYNTGYRKNSFVQTGLVDYDEDGNTVSFTVTEFSTPTFEVVSELDRDEATITVNGSAVTDQGTLLEGLLAYVNTLGENDKVVITLGNKATLGNISLSGLRYLASETFEGSLEIDLHGCTITGTVATATSSDFLFTPACVLKISDSVGGGAIIAPENAGLLYNCVSTTLNKAAVGDEIAYDERTVAAVLGGECHGVGEFLVLTHGYDRALERGDACHARPFHEFACRVVESACRVGIVGIDYRCVVIIVVEIGVVCEIGVHITVLYTHNLNVVLPPHGERD